MARARVVTGAAAAALLLGVLAVRSGTAVDQAGLAEAAPPAPSPSAPDETVVDLLLEANGLPGLRLGTSGASTVSPAHEVQDASGCRLGWHTGLSEGSDLPGADVDWETNAWVVDGEVVAVVVNRWSDQQQASEVLRTWLGPTLGSPLAAAQELPGARTARHTPFGGDGPTVSVVTVPLDGVEVVFGDAPSWPGPRTGRAGTEDPGTRITSIEVRYPAARACAMEELYAAATGAEVLDADGAGRVRLGEPVGPLLADGLLEEETGATSPPPGCRTFVSPEAELRVTAVDDVVVSVQAYGVRRTSFGVQTGDGVDEVRAVFPDLGPVGTAGFASADVEVDGHVVRLEMAEGFDFVPDLERPVLGGPRVVQRFTVLTREAALAGDTC